MDERQERSTEEKIALYREKKKKDITAKKRKIKRKEQRYMTANRTKTGQFAKGYSGNPKGRPPLPPELKEYAKQSPTRLRAIADDENTPVKVKADIEKWFAEMYYGKSTQQVTVDGGMEIKPVVFTGSDEIAD